MKKSILFFAFSCLMIISIQAQNSFAIANSDSPEIVFNTTTSVNSPVDVEENKFREVEKEVLKKLQSQVVFPELAYEYGVAGTVLLQFTFDGEIKDLKVVKSLGAGCDEAAIKALENFPKFYQELGGENMKAIRIMVPFKFER